MCLALYGLLILRTALRGGSCNGAMTDEAAEAKRGGVAQPSWDPTQLGGGRDKIQSPGGFVAPHWYLFHGRHDWKKWPPSPTCPEGETAPKCNIFTWAWASVLPVLPRVSPVTPACPQPVLHKYFEERSLADQDAFLAQPHALSLVTGVYTVFS